MKTVELLCFSWFLTGFFSFSSVDSFEPEAKTETADDDPVSVVINKCDPDSFNSKSEVEQFSKAFGYFHGDLVYNFSFNYSLNGLKNRCKVKTVYFQLDSTSKSKSTSESEVYSTLMPILENENKIMSVQPEFWDYGFFNYTPDFYINPENYCVKNLSGDILTVEICEQAPKSKSNPNPKSKSTGAIFPPTLQKCCPIGFLLTIDKNHNASCAFSDDPPWKPENFRGEKEIYPNYNFKIPCPSSLIYIMPYQLSPKIKWDETSPIRFKDFRFLENGGVETRDSGNHEWKILEQNTFCVDGFDNQLPGDEITKGNSTYNFMLFQCAPQNSVSGEIKDLIYTVTSFISGFVLLLIVSVYALVWNEQNIHGWTSGAFSLSMFLWLFCTGVRLLYKSHGGFCKFIAVLTQFFRISVYSWMLLLNYDLWSTISSMTAHSQRSKGRTRFFWYCCVALGIPTIVVAISLIIENQFSLFDDRVIRPQYGRARCSLDHTAVKAYAIYPTLILILPNFLFILLIIKIVLDLKKGRKNLNREKANNAEVKLCLKLFVIMGISWIFDIISGLLDTDEVSWYWMITDIYNIAQPFLLFWIFICKKTIRDQLDYKYSFFRAGFNWMELHLPCCFSITRAATVSGFGYGQSDSRLTKSSTFKSSGVTSTQFA